MKDSNEAALSQAQQRVSSPGSTGNSGSEALTRALAATDGLFARVFQALGSWQPRVTEYMAQAAAAGGILGTQLAHWAVDESLALLGNPELQLYGAGCCALSPRVVREGNPLAWWQGPDKAQLAASTFGPGQTAIDIARLEWFRVPRETGERHVAGPFVDYLCSNELTVTASVPAVADGEFLGVACVDLLVATLEESLLPSFGGEPLTLINASGRVVVTTNPAMSTGDRWESTAGESLQQLLHSGRAVLSAETPFVLVYEG